MGWGWGGGWSRSLADERPEEQMIFLKHPPNQHTHPTLPRTHCRKREISTLEAQRGLTGAFKEMWL